MMKAEIKYAPTGGLDVKGQEAALRKGPDIVIATPGRLVDFLHNAPSFDLQSIEILVLDEADRFVVSKVHSWCRPNVIFILSSPYINIICFRLCFTVHVGAAEPQSLTHRPIFYIQTNITYRVSDNHDDDHDYS